MKHTVKGYTPLLFVLLLAATPALLAQEKKSGIMPFGSDSPERGTTRVGYWSLDKNTNLAEFAIDYGRPVWKKEYENVATFDGLTKGKIWRLGSDFWTSLDTNIALSISGKTVSPGVWYLGLQRSADGATWGLAFIDSNKSRSIHADASEIARVPVEFVVPLLLNNLPENNERLTILLVYQQSNLKDVTLKIAWGRLQLSTQIQVPSLPQ